MKKKDIKAEVRNWLKRNGFKRIEENHYANDMCGVVFYERDISIGDNDGDEDFVEYGIQSLFTMIGILTWRGYVNMNYIR